MKIQDIYELMDRFEGSSMSELNLEMEGVKVALKKETESAVSAEPVVYEDAKKAERSLMIPKMKEEEEPAGIAVEAPLVGTFYSAPSPEEAPFVTVGSEVKKGDVVGIIEAMKLMNEITAPCDGIITAINVETGQLVEYHQVLMRVK